MTYSGSVTPKATKFLKSEALKMDFDGDLDLDSNDAAIAKTIQKEFQSEMKKRIESQLDHLNEWLAEKDQLIAGLVKSYEEVKKTGLAKTEQAAAQQAKTLKELGPIASKIKNLTDEYRKIVVDWAQNCREQQGQIAMQLAVKAARIKTFNNKSWRVRAGQAIKAVLIVAAIAVSIAAIVVTAGTTAPLFIGLAAAGAALSGISNIAQIGKVIVENADMEKRVLSNVEKDVEAIQVAFGAVQGKTSSLTKHASELQRLITIRKDNIKKLQNEMLPYKGEANRYKEAINGLNGNEIIEAGEIAKKKKAIEGLNAKIADLEAKVKTMEADNAKGETMLALLASLNIDIGKISGQTPNTLLGNLKERFSKLDGWTDLGNTVGGLVNSASGVHH
jgi:chromosome segregation ATPase